MDLVSRQMAARRQRILDAAREIIGQRGFEALTMRDLARESRVTVPTIYNLIGNKEQVLLAAVEDQTARFVAAIEASRGASPSDRALAVVEVSVRELLRLPRYYRALLVLFYTSGAASVVSDAVNDALRGQFGRAVEALEEAGELADWVEAGALVERLRAHLAFTSLQWAAGELTAEGLRSATLYDVSMVLLAATVGESQREFQRTAFRAQERAARLRGARRKPTTPASAESS